LISFVSDTLPWSAMETGKHDEKEKGALAQQDKRPLGVSVEHLRTKFLGRWRNAGLDETTNFFEFDDIIRQASAGIICPEDGKLGAAYVHRLSGEDHVGAANYMLNFSWGYVVHITLCGNLLITKNNISHGPLV
jgi:hypothetical protein